MFSITIREGEGETIIVPISTEGSGTPTMGSKTGHPVYGLERITIRHHERTLYPYVPLLSGNECYYLYLQLFRSLLSTNRCRTFQSQKAKGPAWRFDSRDRPNQRSPGSVEPKSSHQRDFSR